MQWYSTRSLPQAFRYLFRKLVTRFPPRAAVAVQRLPSTAGNDPETLCGWHIRRAPRRQVGEVYAAPGSPRIVTPWAIRGEAQEQIVEQDFRSELHG
jgi:hypothetical protein